MKSLLFIILSDPQFSHRPAEALRIASGMLSLGHPVHIVFSHAALNFFRKPRYETIDYDIIEQSLVQLNKHEATLLFLDTTHATVLPLSNSSIPENFDNYPKLKIEHTEWTAVCTLIENDDVLFLL